MRTLCWMCGMSRHDRIRNDNIRESWVSTYRRKDGKNSTQWSRHVEIRPVDFVDQMEVSQITRGRGRPRKTTQINKLDRDIVYDKTL